MILRIRTFLHLKVNWTLNWRFILALRSSNAISCFRSFNLSFLNFVYTYLPWSFSNHRGPAKLITDIFPYFWTWRIATCLVHFSLIYQHLNMIDFPRMELPLSNLEVINLEVTLINWNHQSIIDDHMWKESRNVIPFLIKVRTQITTLCRFDFLVFQEEPFS